MYKTAREKSQFGRDYQQRFTRDVMNILIWTAQYNPDYACISFRTAFSAIPSSPQWQACARKEIDKIICSR
jgi:hypothetical protein